MKHYSSICRAHQSANRGFTLILTVSLLVLLMVIAVGMLSLSSVSLRTSSYQLSLAEARSNARLSMQMALAQLQSLSGQDTRVTAPSLKDPSIPVTGVWRSWEGTDHEATGKPKAPNYGLKNQVGDPGAIPSESSSDGRFLGWLTSSTAFTDALEPTEAVTGVVNVAGAGYVPMVQNGSVVKDDARQVHVQPTMLEGNRGAIAWWTSGENSKARINSDRVEKPASTVAWQQRVRSNGMADAKFFGLENISSFPLGGSVPSSATLKLVNADAEVRKIHDLTSFSRGLLTNTATGGWRRDLSVFSEISKWNERSASDYPGTTMPLFTLEPGKMQTYSKAQPSGALANPLIYPWATYRNNASDSAWQQVPPICSWSALVDYTQQYKSIFTSSAARTAMHVTTSIDPKGGAGGDRFKYQDTVRRFPQIARIQWVYSLCSFLDANATDTKKQYRAGLLVTPVLTMWNPYNVELSTTAFTIGIQQISPLRFQFKVGSEILQQTTLSEITRTDYTKGNDNKETFNYEGFVLNIPASVFKPGESRIFGITDPTPRIDTRTDKSALNVSLSPGYRPNGGYLFFGVNKGAFVYGSASDAFSIEKITYDGETREGALDGSWKPGIGFLFDMKSEGESFSHRMVYNIAELGGDSVVSAWYPPLTKRLSSTLEEVKLEKNQPFASSIFAYRTISPMSGEPARHKHLYTKGMLQANPLCFYTEIGFGDDANAVTSMAGTGVYHPVNAPYDFAFQDMNGWNDTLAAPQFESTTNASYIVSGLSAGDGLTRCVMAELPTRPLQSLAELQHFDARNNNPIPPFQFNLIGNGSAHPIFAPDQLSVSTTYNNGMCNDDCYMLNHLLFDDWFVSSIAPDLQDFSKSVDRSISAVYKDHLTGTTPLPNRFYLPTPDATMVDGKRDVDQAVANVVAKTPDSKTGLYGYESVATKLEVDGMFNVNSISLDAWKALLRQSRDVKVPYLASNGSTNGGDATSFPYARSSIAGDQAANSGSTMSNPTFPQAAEFAGYRTLTDEQVDALAEEIVKEIKLRGPFLSLSEFVNRQVSTNKDLAIAATIQKALDNLANLGSSSKNPFETLQALSQKITTKPVGATSDYKFEEAALGWSAFGLPGWVRQADILRPLAPVLSARDDTFTIRAYGDARDPSNSSKILAKAWCEVTVQRQASYVDPTDKPEILPFSAKMKSNVNKRFGRRYEIVGFRWLNESEI